MNPLSEHKAAEREAIARAAEQFLKAGGKVHRLPGPTFPAPPPRREPVRKAKPQPKRRGHQDSAISRYKKHGPQCLAMFERGETLKAIAQAVDKSDAFVLACLDFYGIDAKGERAKVRAREEAEFVAQLKELARDGHSMRWCAGHLGVGWGKVKYQADKHGIEFRTR